MTTPVLRLADVSAGYGGAQILRDVSIDVAKGEILCLLGRNGAGKTTTMKAIMGLITLMSGAIELNGETISGAPAHKVPLAGIGYVPQGRRLFSELSVSQNLDVGLMARKSDTATRERVLDLFPRLRERLNQRAETLSGGEQQMLATARALCLNPTVLLLDEPTEGLQPSMIALIRDVVVRMKSEGVAILLVEQRVDAVLSIADRVAFLDNGHLRETVGAHELRSDQALLEKYVGV